MAACDELVDAMETIDPYVAAHAAEYGGAWIDQAAGGLVRVLFTDSLTEHARALAEVFPYPDQLRVDQARYPLAELEALAEQIADDAAALIAEGIDVATVGVREQINRVRIGVRAYQEPKNVRLAALYGDAVVVVPEDVSPAARD